MSRDSREPKSWQSHTSAILSGFFGDWLAQRESPLAVKTALLHEGKRLDLAKLDIPQPKGTVILLVHGLMGQESIWEFPGQPGVHYGSELAQVMDANALCLRYNSGRPVHYTGATLTNLLQTLKEHWPVPLEKLVLIGHSMGGLVIRSACHQGEIAGHSWPQCVESCVYLGAPHDGSWLAQTAHETAGMMQSMPTAYLKVVGKFIDSRSEGIRNLTAGDILKDLDQSPPLLAGARHFAVAGLLSKRPGHALNRIFGDLLVKESSARGGGRKGWTMTDSVCFTGVSHVRLAHSARINQQLREWLT
ncbi:MAG: alpha/beta hydrolase [Oleiphilaceae bacterium]|nr:alpha/beta hydrolase [Oleiphilaceae bacterium]